MRQRFAQSAIVEGLSVKHTTDSVQSTHNFAHSVPSADDLSRIPANIPLSNQNGIPLHLNETHRAMLTRGSGIAEEVIRERGYRSIHGASAYTELKALGFSRTLILDSRVVAFEDGVY